MYQLISIGSALVDIFIHSADFQAQTSTEGKKLCHTYGDKLEVESFNVYTGGGASNTAVGFARLGLKTAIVSETGRDRFAYLVKQELLENRVSTKLLIEEKKEQTGGSVILVGEDGERTIMVHRGASSMLDPYDIPSFYVSQAEWIHLSSIAGRTETLTKVFDLVSREQNLNLSWNPGKNELQLLLDKQIKIESVPAKILILNQAEWELIKPLQKISLAHFPQVVVTAGPEGGVCYYQDKQTKFQAQPVEVVDTTGAGDAFAVGYVAAQILNKPIGTAIKWGVTNASSVIQYYGAKPGLLSQRELPNISTGTSKTN